MLTEREFRQIKIAIDGMRTHNSVKVAYKENLVSLLEAYTEGNNEQSPDDLCTGGDDLSCEGEQG